MADWSELPSDLLTLILETFAHDIRSVVRAAAVCSTWRRASAAMLLPPPRLPCQTPWLMFHSVDDRDPTASHFYSLSEKGIYTLSLPDPPIRTRPCIGSSCGWLITADDMAELYLLNPITGAQISLPPIRTLGPITDPPIENLVSCLYGKAVMSCAPLEDNCVVMLLHDPHSQLSYARPGNERWNFVTHTDKVWYLDCIYHNGLFYAMTSRECIQVWDLSGPSPQYKGIIPLFRPSFRGEFAYLVQAPWGDLLLVWRQRDCFDDDFYLKGTVKIEVYKWVAGSPTRMEKMVSLGDHALFLGFNHSFCLPTKDFPYIKPNCIYLIDGKLEMVWYGNEDERDVGIYHLKDGSFEHILPPDAQMIWPPPIWITPSID